MEEAKSYVEKQEGGERDTSWRRDGKGRKLSRGERKRGVREGRNLIKGYSKSLH